MGRGHAGTFAMSGTVAITSVLVHTSRNLTSMPSICSTMDWQWDEGTRGRSR